MRGQDGKEMPGRRRYDLLNLLVDRDIECLRAVSIS